MSFDQRQRPGQILVIGDPDFRIRMGKRDLSDATLCMFIEYMRLDARMR